MQIHQIIPKTKSKKGKYIGRGGKRGTYSGRGIKGQKARAGRKMRPEIRDMIKKLPKKRVTDSSRSKKILSLLILNL